MQICETLLYLIRTISEVILQHISVIHYRYHPMIYILIYSYCFTFFPIKHYMLQWFVLTTPEQAESCINKHLFRNQLQWHRLCFLNILIISFNRSCLSFLPSRFKVSQRQMPLLIVYVILNIRSSLKFYITCELSTYKAPSNYFRPIIFWSFTIFEYEILSNGVLTKNIINLDYRVKTRWYWVFIDTIFSCWNNPL